MYAIEREPQKAQIPTRSTARRVDKKYAVTPNFTYANKAPYYRPQGLTHEQAAQLFGWKDLKSGASKLVKKMKSVLKPEILAAVMEAVNPLSNLTKDQRINKILDATKSVAKDELLSVLNKIGVPADMVMAVIEKR